MHAERYIVRLQRYSRNIARSELADELAQRKLGEGFLEGSPRDVIGRGPMSNPNASICGK